jgi:hypothetical protein
MTADEIALQFTRSDGSYLCARWGRPIVPVIFGVEDSTLSVVKGAIEAVVTLAQHRMAETDPELGANLMMFFLRDWSELTSLPGIEGLIKGMHGITAKLDREKANQYRMFRFDAEGAIRAVFCFVRIDSALIDVPAEDLALDLAVRMMLTWADGAFLDRSVLTRFGGEVVLVPEIAAIIRAAYDPVLPAVARDASHGLRLAARMAQT